MYIHGMAQTRFYNIWCGINTRCFNKNVKIFKYYGNRGIKVCKRWQVFINFRDDMYKSYLKHVKEFGENNTSIDRINNNGNYSFNNCKWNTTKEQVRNRRDNRYYTYNNKTQCITDWAKQYSLPRNTLLNRLNRNIPIHIALNMKKSSRHKFNHL